MRFHGHAKLTKFPFFAKLYVQKSVLLLINCVILPRNCAHTYQIALDNSLTTKIKKHKKQKKKP